MISTNKSEAESMLKVIRRWSQYRAAIEHDESAKLYEIVKAVVAVGLYPAEAVHLLQEIDVAKCPECFEPVGLVIHDDDDGRVDCQACGSTVYLCDDCNEWTCKDEFTSGYDCCKSCYADGEAYDDAKRAAYATAKGHPY